MLWNCPYFVAFIFPGQEKEKKKRATILSRFLSSIVVDRKSAGLYHLPKLELKREMNRVAI